MAGAAVRRLTLLWVGRPAAAAIEAVARDYVQRLRRFVGFDEIRVRPAPGRADAARARASEAAALRRHLAPGDLVIFLDERAAVPTTRELAARLEAGLRRARVVLVVGSDLGLDEELVAEGETLSLSRLTLSHALARVVILEQLYRCLDLLAGGAYHRE